MLDVLLSHLRTVAPDSADVPILQPADPFLETAGEDLRRRIFITESVGGSVKCLRPDFTIPICLAHGGGAARYAYGGTVFRQSRKGGSEFDQVGLEDLGNEDRPSADAACISDMLDALARAPLGDPHVTLGDQGLFAVVVDNLKLPAAVAARLMRAFGDPAQIDRVLADLTKGARRQNGEGRAEALALAGDETGLVTHVREQLALANISEKSGRSPADIARRMIAKIRDANFRIDTDHANIMRQFLSIELPLEEAGDALSDFARQAGLDFSHALTGFDARTLALGARGIRLDRITYRASFGRKLDYYTGLLFDVEAGGVSVGGGGRYDRLCTVLGKPEPVAAVGFSIALDRLAQAMTKGA